jgi:hypothetical protein
VFVVCAPVIWEGLLASFSLGVPVSPPTHSLVSTTFAWMIVVVPACAAPRVVEISHSDAVNFPRVITTKCAVHRLLCSVTMTQG